MINLGSQNVLGVQIDAVDYETCVSKIVDAGSKGLPLSVSALAVHGVMTGVLDDEHRHRLNRLDLVVPDGQPVRWALRWLHGIDLPDRVYGPNLMLETCRAAEAEGLPLFLFGGTEEMLQNLQQRLVSMFPRLEIAGTRASLFRRLSPQECDEVVAEIRDSGAAITALGLGCPRQEVTAYEMRDRLQMPVLAVGAAFAFHAGMLSQAPGWFQRHGLEWLYRLAMEPRRLWRRYMFLNPLYLALLFLQKAGLRRFCPEASTPPRVEVRYG
jgi:exopolysaccharide biosynthesis WecB/TagA/CpsF family protein